MLLLELLSGAEQAAGVRPSAQVRSRQARFVIGRGAKCDWPLPDRDLAISARHCEIVGNGPRLVLRDLSTNGTFVNGSRKRLDGEHVLRDGDRFQVGKFLIGVRVVAETDQTVAIAQPQRRVARGGDPAAVADSQWRASGYDPRAPGLGMSSGFTRIAKPWVDTSTDDSPAYATVPNVRPPEGDDEVLAGDAGDFVASAAEGLGLSVKELVKAIGSADPSTIAQRVARLLRVATFALHHQLLLESRQLRAITGQAALGHADPLVQRLLEAASPQLAVGELLAARGDAEVALVHAHGELGQHSQRLIAAFGAACQRLGELLDPERQAQAAGSAGSAELWQGYVSLWKGLGMSAGQPWSDCLVDAAGAYLCEAYAQAQAEPGGGGEGEAGA